MIDKVVGSPAEAVACIGDGATVMIGGFGEAGSPIDGVGLEEVRAMTGAPLVAAR